jgi:hypothetical protein
LGSKTPFPAQIRAENAKLGHANWTKSRILHALIKICDSANSQPEMLTSSVLENNAWEFGNVGNVFASDYGYVKVIRASRIHLLHTDAQSHHDVSNASIR